MFLQYATNSIKSARTPFGHLHGTKFVPIFKTYSILYEAEHNVLQK